MKVIHSGKVTSIYTAFHTIQIVPKQLHNNEQENAVLSKFTFTLQNVQDVNIFSKIGGIIDT